MFLYKNRLKFHLGILIEQWWSLQFKTIDKSHFKNLKLGSCYSPFFKGGYDKNGEGALTGKEVKVVMGDVEGRGHSRS